MQSTRVTRRRKRAAGLVAAAALAGGMVAAAPAQAADTGYSCISPLSIWGPGNVGAPQADGQGNKNHELIDFLKLRVSRDGQPISYKAGEQIELDDLSLTARIDNQDFLKRLWIGSGGKPMIPDVGTTTYPLWVWVAIKGTNTKEGVQVVQARATYDFTVKDPTPGTFKNPGPFYAVNNDPLAAALTTNLGRLVSPNHPAAYIQDDTQRSSGDEVISPIEANVLLPKLKWTPTGGDVKFTLADPGSLGTIKVLARYTGRGNNDVNRWHRVRPFGSVYVRAETFLYGMNNDCVYGNIALSEAGANGTIPANGNGYFAGQGGQRYTFWGNGSPTQPNFDLGPEDAVGPPAGSPASATGGERSYAPLGVAGRYNISQQNVPVIAEAKAEPAVPDRPLTVGTARSKSGAGAFTVRIDKATDLAVNGRIRANSAAAVRVGGKRRVIPVSFANDLVVGEGVKTKHLRLALTPAAQTLLRTNRTLRVRVIVEVPGKGKVNRVVTVTR